MQDVSTDARSMLSVETSVIDSARLCDYAQHHKGLRFKASDLNNLRKRRKFDGEIVDRVFIGDTPEAPGHAYSAFFKCS